jgi:hypothetical protein
MKPIIIKIIIFYGLLVSCYKPYDPNIVANDKILVVEGMITNEVSLYHVRLSYASPFDSRGTGQPVNFARVYVNDDLGNYYPFRELKIGSYISDSLQFTGHPGRIYTLYIETPDGEVYISDPQRLYPEFCPDTVYAEADYQESISRFNGIIFTRRGANILINIRSDSDTLPRFRFTSNLVKQYNYIILGYMTAYQFYAWETDNTILDINLTHKEYSFNSSSINKHAVYFVDDKINFEGWKYELGPLQPDLSYKALATYNRQYYPISYRILYLNQYSLNNEAYLYYKSMDEQLRAEGKLFDPIAVQLRGNINCTTNPAKITFGFFEASSVSRTSYDIGFRRYNDQYSVTKIPYILPPEPNGCWINKVPPFWAYY